MNETVSEDIRSFVSFALAMKPALTMRRKEDTRGPSMTLTVSTHERLEEEELDSLEPLMAKYAPLKPYLDAIGKADISISGCKPTSNFEPNVHYRLVRITGNQYRIAKEVSQRLNRIHAAYTDKQSSLAKQEYETFHAYLAQERAALTGEFKGIQFTNAVASYGVGRGVADDDCSGQVIFVVIEIIIVCPDRNFNS